MRPRSRHEPPAGLEAVLGGAGAGSVEAFEAIYEALASPVAGYLRMNGVADVDEVTNEVFLQVHQALGGFTGDWAGFRSWVFTIAHHRMVDEARRARRRPSLVLTEVVAEPPPGNAEGDAMEALSDERVRSLLDRLSPDQRQVLLLRIVADLSLVEVATALDKTVGAVKSLQHRALAALQRSLEQEATGHGP